MNSIAYAQWAAQITAWSDPNPRPFDPDPEMASRLAARGWAWDGRIHVATEADLRRIVADEPREPDVSVPVLAHQRVRAWPAADPGRRPGLAAYVDLDVALGRRHQTDAMIAAYSVPAQLHRLRQSAPVALGGVPMVLLVADVDRHDLDSHPDAIAHWQRGCADKLWRWVGAGTGRVAHSTRAGLRLIQRLRDPHVIRGDADAAAWRAGYLAWLAALGDELRLIPDPACADWTRLHRLPCVVRDGVRVVPLFHYSSACRSPDGALPAALTPADRRIMMRWSRTHAGWRRTLDGLAGPAPRGGPRRIASARDVPPGLVAELTEAMALVGDGRHEIYLALAGALLGSGVTPEDMIETVEAVSRAAGDTDERVRRRAADARSTAARWRARETVTGRARLHELAPAVATALDRALPPVRHDQRAHLARLLAEEGAVLDAVGRRATVAEAPERIREALVDSEVPC